jgi:hypothetical protein
MDQASILTLDSTLAEVVMAPRPAAKVQVTAAYDKPTARTWNAWA